ncbi:MAG: beta-propeller fold lactonase family protein [Vicinamibacterales bacterium]
MPLLIVLLAALLFEQAASSPAPSPPLDYDYYKARVEPLFLEKRPEHARCVTCHAGSTTLRLQAFSAGASAWSEEQTRLNFDAVSKMVVPGSPGASRLLRHPLSRTAGGDVFHGGGKHWTSKDDAEWQTLAAWVNGEKLVPATASRVARIVQTNAAGDNVHLIDPATNKVVGVINDIEVPHGVTSAPDGSRLYITNEARSTLDVVDAKSLAVSKRIPLSGHPNNVAISLDGRRVYVGIAVAPGAVDVIDTASLTNAKSIAVKGAIHNVYVTPDGKYVVSGSIPTRTLTVIDQPTETVSWELQMSAGIRPITFERAPDGSTSRMFVQLSDYHGIAVVDFASRKEVSRFELPAIPGEEKHTEGLQGAPAHGLAVTPDGKILLATSKVYGQLYAYSLPELKPIGNVHVGQHPEWMTLTPDGKQVYVAAAGDNSVTAVDLATLKVVAKVPVGQVPKRNGTALLQK